MKTFDDWWATLTTREQARMTKADVTEAWEAAVLAEREACARVCDALAGDEYLSPRDRACAVDCATDIRERSNAEITGG